MYLLSVPKSAAAQLIFSEICSLLCLGVISVFAVAVYLLSHRSTGLAGSLTGEGRG